MKLNIDYDLHWKNITAGHTVKYLVANSQHQSMMRMITMTYDYHLAVHLLLGFECDTIVCTKYCLYIPPSQ